jgi:hypothetical protein
MGSKSLDPLKAFLTQVSTSVYISLPSTQDKSTPVSAYDKKTSSTTKPPDIILLLSWSGANKAHIAKYIPGYRALYPSSRIILITSAYGDFIFPGRASQVSQLEQVIRIVASIPNGTLLIHLFSNGGSHKLWRLAKQYRKTEGRLMPMTALVLDSAPGKADRDRTIAAVSYELPKIWFLRLPLLGILFLYAYFSWAKARVFNSENIINCIWQDLNNPLLFDKRASRCYIYSHQDRMVWWKDVEDHANHAEAKGYVVTKEEFDGSEHVAHMRLQSDRYWKITEKVWEMASDRQNKKDAS